MTIVLDSSAAFEIILQREMSEKFAKLIAESEWLIAPDIFISEVTNTAWKLYNFGSLDQENAVWTAESAIGLIGSFVSAEKYWKEALGESIHFKHSVYDIFYLLVARRNNAHLLTMDKKLNQIAESAGVKVN